MADSITPNQYQLSGKGLKISYNTSSFDGKPRLTYQKGKKQQNFAGDQIRVEKTEIGSLLTVTIAMTVDRGFTTFSVLIPEIHLAKIGAKQAFKTTGIQTEHKTSIGGPGLVKGVLETYKVIPLSGSATNVFFVAETKTATA